MGSERPQYNWQKKPREGKDFYFKDCFVSKPVKSKGQNNCDNIGTFWYQINGVLQLSQKLLGKKIDLFLGILKRAKFMKLPVDAPAKNSKK